MTDTKSGSSRARAGTRANTGLKGPTRRRVSAEAIERACRKSGLRLTGPRKLIAQVIGEAEDHPDVVELHRRVAALDERISLSTVYRTVKRFETEGIIERLDLRDGRARYESAPPEHHDHLINLETGDVIEFRSEEIEALQEAIARKLGFRVVYHRLELYAVPLAPGQGASSESGADPKASRREISRKDASE